MKSFFVVIFSILTMAYSQAQNLEIQSKWYNVVGDSIRVEFCHPNVSVSAPSIIVLTDRFGIQTGTRAILTVLAKQGFRAYTIPLRSAQTQKAEGIPQITLDTIDADIVTQISVDILNESGCDGQAGLFAFDVGATIGALAASRSPVFKSCVFFYPANSTSMSRLLPRIYAKVLLSVGEFDPEYTLAKVNEIREAYMETGRILKVNFHKGAGPFFFNPEHENHHRKNFAIAWNETLKFFGSTLK